MQRTNGDFDTAAMHEMPYIANGIAVGPHSEEAGAEQWLDGLQRMDAVAFPSLAGKAGESRCGIVQPWSSRGHAAGENACIQAPFGVLCPP